MNFLFASPPAPNGPAQRRVLPRCASLLGVVALLSACSSNQFMEQYLALDQTSTAATAKYCPNVKQMTAEDLHGDWALELTQMRQQGEMRLSQHPEFSDSLRAHVRYGPLRAIASGDVKDGNFDLDESSDGKRLTATWSGSLPAGDCGRIIRGVWTEVDTQLKSSFVLRRLTPLPGAPAAHATPSSSAAAMPARQVPSGTQTDARAHAPAAASTSQKTETNDHLPEGVQVMPVPDPGFN